MRPDAPRAFARSECVAFRLVSSLLVGSLCLALAACGSGTSSVTSVAAPAAPAAASGSGDGVGGGESGVLRQGPGSGADMEALVAVLDDSARVLVSYATDGSLGDLVQIDDQGGNARCALVGDFDGDGDLDIICAAGSDGSIRPYLYRGGGDGTFGAAEALDPLSGSDGWAMDGTTADFDEDGDLDLIMSGNYTTSAYYRGNGDGTFEVESRTLPHRGRGTDVGDFDEDGHADLVRATYSDGYVRLYLGAGDGTFTEVADIIGDVGSDPYAVVAGDFDSDGHDDVLANSGGGGDFQFFGGNGDGTFRAAVARPEIDIGNHGAADAYDFDGDGYLDLVLTAYSSRRVYLWPGRGDGTFGDQVTIGGRPGSASLGISAPPLHPKLDLRIEPGSPSVALGDPLALMVAGADLDAADDVEWQFGDGEEATGLSVSHAWDDEGVFDVRMLHTGADGLRRARRTLVTVHGDSPVAATGGPYALGESASSQNKWTATLDGTGSTDDHEIVSYAWDFGDGSTGEGATPQHTWSDVGPWTVRLTVTDSSGLSDIDETTVTFAAGSLPVPVITGPSVIDETSATDGRWHVTFDATSSTDDVGIWKYYWNFGNGRTSSQATAEASYDRAGTYTVTLSVTDHAGQLVEATHEIQVVANDPPIAHIAGPDRVDESAATGGLWATHWDGTGSTDDTGVYRYQWDFGDGASGSGETIDHAYTTPGVYTVTLTVTDHGDQTATEIQVVEVVANDPPVAGISASTTTVEGAQPIRLSAAPSTDDFGIHSYLWNLPSRRFSFDADFVDSEVWGITSGVDQAGRILATGTGGWNRVSFSSVGLTVPRGVTLEGRVDTPTGYAHAMVGLKKTGSTSGHYNQLVHGIYFAEGNVYIYELGSNRGHKGSYSPGTSYDIRIVTEPVKGALYYIRPSGSGAAFELIHDGNRLENEEFVIAADIHSGVFGFDDFRVDRAVAHGSDVTAATEAGGVVTLTVMDNALQEHSTSITIAAVTGAAPQAIIAGPSEVEVGVDALFDARGSSDDRGITGYSWDFGDGSGTAGPDAFEVSHFYGTPGTYTVTLTVRDAADQTGVATHTVTVGGESLVKAVPWRIVGGIELPHETWSGREAVLKAVAAWAALPLTYTWDFGDGSAPAVATASTREEAYGLQARHVYEGSEGTPFTATVTVEDAAGNVSSDTYPLIIRDRSIEVEVNVAIDEGLWYLHRTQERSDIDAVTRGGRWTFGGYQSGVTASAVQAFAINGHRESGSGADDPYVETVSRGMNHLMTLLRHVNIGPQTYGDPDANGNGIGLEPSVGQVVYELGQIMDAVVAGGRPDLVARAGPANVKGRRYGDIVQDMVDMYAWGQYDHATTGGGWRYSWNQHPDNSACQWAAIGSIAAEDVFGIAAPQWVKDRNLVWLDYSKSANGFGYTGPGSGEALTPSGMVQLAWDGVPRSDPLWMNGENALARDWPNIMARNNFYAYFAIAKAMRLQDPPVTRFDLTGKDWFLDPGDGLARVLVDRQDATDGSWMDSRWIRGREYSTAWAVIILSSTLFQEAPVAVIHARPNPGAVGQEILFDATGSFHQDPTFDIVQYRWDFDNSDGIDFDTPDAVGPVVTHTFGELRTYSVTLQVKDNNTPPLYDTSSVEIHITIPPHPPTAAAGGPYVAAVGEDVVLDGSGSYDIDAGDGDSIQSWDWEVDFEQPLDFADGVSGETATIIGGFDSAGTKNVGLRVTDRTASAFPSAGEPDLTDDDFTTVLVYQRVVDDLAARAKGSKIQLTWTHQGGDEPRHYQVYRSELGPNVGFELIGATESTYSTYLDTGLPLNRTFYYRILVYEVPPDGSALGDPLGASNVILGQTAARDRDRNRAPRIVNDPPLEAAVGIEYQWDVDAVDPEGAALTYSLTAAPVGMTIDATSGLISFTPTDAQLGLHDVFVEARDPLGAIGPRLYQLAVVPEPNQAPSAEANGPYVALRGDAIAFSSAGSDDPDGDDLSYSWNFGDGTTGGGASPSHVYTASGNFVVTLIVSDGRGGVASDEATVQIDEPNRAPTALVAGGPDFSIRMGRELAVDGSPSEDLDGDPLTYSWSWGDSTAPGSGETASHAYAAEGVFLAALSVSDGRGGVDTYEFTVTVGSANSAPVAAFDITVAGTNPGDEFTFDGSASQDPDGDPIELTWDFGDGSSTTGLIVTHVYSQPGDFTVTLAARDAFDGEGTAQAAVHINAAPAFQTSPATSVTQDDLFAYAPEVTDADGQPVTLTLTLAPAGVAYSPDDGTLTWTPGNDDVGTHAFELTAEDPSGGVTRQSFSLTVVDRNDPPSILSTPLTVATEGEPYEYAVQAEDIDDGSLSYELTAAPVGMTIDGSATVRWIPSNADVGSHPVTLRVSDPRGGETTQSWTLAVSDVNDPPVIVSAPPTSATEGSLWTYDLEAVDEDDPGISYRISSGPAGMTIGAATGRVEWTPDVGGRSEGVVLEAVDTRGGVASQAFSIQVTNVNDAPEVLSTPPTRAAVAREYVYAIAAVDEEGDAISFAATEAPLGLSVDAAGVVTWTPDDGDVGANTVAIEVRDAPGAVTEHRWSIEVQERNQPPEITSSAVTVALEDAEYVYDVVAEDPEGGQVIFSLDVSPAGMAIDASTGRITWTPGASDVGDHPVVVVAADDLGDSGEQLFTLGVAAVNDAPEITSSPVTSAEAGFAYAYAAEATDEEGDALTWSLPTAPAGMDVDPGSGVVTWTPTASQVGDRSVELRVTDAHGARTSQEFTVSVADEPHAPVLSSIPAQVVQDPRPFTEIRLDDHVTDPDHGDDEIDWSVSGEAELSVAIDADRVATISYPDGTRVTEEITFIATDPDGLSASVTAAFTVAEPSDDDVPPVLALTVEPTSVAVGGSVTATIRATDNEGISSVSLRVAGVPVAVTPAGEGAWTATWTADTTGVQTVEAQALDLAGNSFTDSVDILVADPSLGSSLAAAIDSPAEDTLLAEIVDVVGTASGENFADYRLAVAPIGTTDFVEVASGDAPVAGASLGSVDSGLLENGVHTLRLTVRDLSGRSMSVDRTVRVEGDAKVGVFTLTYQDKVLPLGRVPLMAVRVYDSRRKTKGDFGYGWSLSFRGPRAEENRIPGDDWQQVRSGGFLPSYQLVPTESHTVTVHLDETTRHEFTARPNPDVQTLLPIQFLNGMQFTPLAGSSGSLVPNRQADMVLGVEGPVEIVDSSFNLYHPSAYTFTHADGTVYRFAASSTGSLRHDLQSVTEPNGVTTTLGAGGLVRSDGKSLFIERDGEGRITRITDPEGGEVAYEYDIRGDLVAVVDEEGARSEFRYDRHHNIVEVIDPLGTGRRAEYDDDGRLVLLVLPGGETMRFDRDLGARQEVVTDADGNTLVFIYDEAGRVLQRTDGRGAVTSFTYDASGNTLTETDPLGNTTAWTYDGSGNKLTETDPLGNTTAWTYDAAGRVTTRTDALGAVTSFGYDPAGNLLTEVDPLGNTVRTHVYDASGHRTSTTDALGNVVEYEYDASGNRTAIVDALGNRTEYEYDANGRVVSETDASGAVVATELDARGLFTAKTDPFGNTSRFEYDEIGQLVASVDPAGRRTERVLDASGRELSTELPGGGSHAYTYGGGGELRTITDALGRTTRHEYDEAGNRVATVLPDGARIEHDYDLAGRHVASTDAAGNVTRFEYDAAGRHVRTIDPLGGVFETEYDAAGRVVREVDAAGHAYQMAYDAANRLTRRTLPGGGVEEFGYDALGNMTSRTDPLGNVERYEYDAAGRLVTVTDALGGETTYQRDELGQIVSVTDAAGRTRSWEYDAGGRVVREVKADGSVETFEYDASGSVVAMVDAAGQRTTYEYDAKRRLSRQVMADGTEYSYAYDALGQLASVTDARGVTSYAYDVRGQVVAIENPDGSSLEYTWDGDGNRTSVTTYVADTDPGRTTLFGYDELGRLATVTDESGAVATYAYDSRGNRASVAYPNGLETRYTYDGLNRLTRLEHRSGGTLLGAYDYTVDAAGRRTLVTELDGSTVEYGYDELGRLTSELRDDGGGATVLHMTYTYDAVGNRLSATDELSGTTVDYVYDAADRLVSAGDTTFGYDGRGQLVSRTRAGQTTTYGYDASGRMTSVTAPAGGVTTYVYDASGLLVERTDAVGTTRFLQDPQASSGFAQVLEEYGDTRVSYVHGDDLLAQDRGGVVSYYHADGTGSIRLLSSDAGAVTDTYTFDAFGNLIASTGSTANDFLYAGERIDPNSGFYDLRARHYDPEVGRFTTPDPKRSVNEYDPVGLHKYLYGHANPVSNRDPSGRETLVSQMVTIAIINVLISVVWDAIQGKSPQEIFLNAMLSLAFSLATAGLGGLVASKVTSMFSSAIVKAGLTHLVIPLLKAGVSTIGFYMQGYVAYKAGLSKEPPSVVETAIVFAANFIIELLFFIPNGNDIVKAGHKQLTKYTNKQLARKGYTNIFEYISREGIKARNAIGLSLRHWDAAVDAAGKALVENAKFVPTAATKFGDVIQTLGGAIAGPLAGEAD